MSFSLIFTVSCRSNTQAPSGALPTWKVGDTWTTRSSGYDGIEVTSVETVTGEQVFNGIDCYTIEGTSTSMGMTDTVTGAFDKTTLLLIESEISSSINGTANKWTQKVSCNYSVKPYPLSVGKTWTVTGNETYTSLMMGTNRTTTYPYTSIWKVEKVESITVPAGTFQCFKIVQYNSSTNAVFATRWITDVTGGFPVKTIYMISGQTSELISCSLSE